MERSEWRDMAMIEGLLLGSGLTRFARKKFALLQ